VDRAEEAAEVGAETLLGLVDELFRERGVVYNINVPRIEDLCGREVIWTHQSTIPEQEVFDRTGEGEGRRYFRPRFGDWCAPERGSDRWAMGEGRISVTRLRATLSEWSDVMK
jgi:broad specificity polyphosphatase/5'/3'-nucleotidase SurE